MDGQLDNGKMKEIIDETIKLSLTNQIACSQIKEYDEKEIYCPFTWKECYEKFDGFDWIKHLNSILLRTDPNDWHTYCYMILLGCIYVHQKEEEEATNTFDSIEKLLEENESENFFREIMEGLQHVLSSCRLYMNIKMDKNEAAREIFSTLKSFHDLNKKCQAGVLAVKAYILQQFGYDGQLEAFKCAKSATALDPDESGMRRGAWYYLAGKLLFDHRNSRAHNEIPSDEEKELVERSTKINPFPVHFTLLADVYRETAKVLLQRSFKRNKHKSDKLCREAKRLYENAYNDENASVNCLYRSGTGMIRLPKAYRNLEIPRKAFSRILSNDPENGKALVSMGKLLEWNLHDYEQALIYYQRSYDLGWNKSGYHVVKMKYKLDKRYNPLEDCEKYIKNLENMMDSRAKDDLHVLFLIIKTEFYLVVKGDLMSAVHEWEKAVAIFPDSRNIREHHCIFVDEEKAILCQKLLNAINQALKDKNLNRTDEEYLEETLKTYDFLKVKQCN